MPVRVLPKRTESNAVGMTSSLHLNFLLSFFPFHFKLLLWSAHGHYFEKLTLSFLSFASKGPKTAVILTSLSFLHCWFKGL